MNVPVLDKLFDAKPQNAIVFSDGDGDVIDVQVIAQRIAEEKRRMDALLDAFRL